MKKLFYILVQLVFLFSLYLPAGAQTKSRILTLDLVKIEGSARLPENFAQEELGLTAGQAITPQALQEIQLKLHGLGLFKSVLVTMEKSSERGKVNLVIELEDDPSVLGRWALGGTLKVTHGEASTQTLAEDQPPLGFTGELISRNLFGLLHRGRLNFDLDSRGVYQNIAASYGFPRFSQEGVQFDAHIRVTDVENRYRDAMGFGSEGSGIWSYDTKFGTFKYGLAIHTNRPPRFTVPGFPKSLVGPKFSLELETRLHRFLPSPGYRIEPSILLPPGNYDLSIFRLEAATTQRLLGDSFLTLEGKFQTVGAKGVSGRAIAQIDIPLDQKADQGALYFNYYQGFDRMADQKLWGRSVTMGLRYHSFGFIAELAVKITDAPRVTELENSEVTYE